MEDHGDADDGERQHGGVARRPVAPPPHRARAAAARRGRANERPRQPARVGHACFDRKCDRQLGDHVRQEGALGRDRIGDRAAALQDLDQGVGAVARQAAHLPAEEGGKPEHGANGHGAGGPPVCDHRKEHGCQRPRLLSSPPMKAMLKATALALAISYLVHAALAGSLRVNPLQTDMLVLFHCRSWRRYCCSTSAQHGWRASALRRLTVAPSASAR